MDEREVDKPTKENPVNLPGGTAVLVDTLKALYQYTEEEAWTLLKDSGVPMDMHTDSHHGARGCGYEKLVEDNPGIVLAVESISASERLQTARRYGARVVNYIGEHDIRKAVINYHHGKSIDQDQKYAHSIVSCDAWAVGEYAKKINKTLSMRGVENRVNGGEMTSHVVNVFQNTVIELTNGKVNQFEIIN